MKLQQQDSVDGLHNVCKEPLGFSYKLVPATVYLYLQQHQHHHIFVNDSLRYPNLLILKIP